MERGGTRDSTRGRLRGIVSIKCLNIGVYFFIFQGHGTRIVRWDGEKAVMEGDVWRRGD